MNDKELADRIQKGESEAINRFVDEHYNAVARLMIRLTNHREEAEDLTQQTFVVVRKKISSFRGKSSLKTWVHSIAINEYRQWLRKRRWTTNVIDDEPTRDPAFETFESGYVLNQAIAQLSPKLREAFVLFEVEQLSMNEVIAVLKVPSGTAKARVAAARQKLRSLLEEQSEVKKDELQKSTS